MPSQQKIIIGIDFGTTYSGVAWADSTSPKDKTPIRQWPDAVGRQDVDKVPSEMVYLPDGTFKWGFQTTAESIRKEGTVLRYMKLLLDPSQEEGSQLADPLGLSQIRDALPPGKNPVDVVADYLRAIKEHALEVLSHNFGTEFWKVIDIEYHLTIPAVWSESAKALTLKAANQAGIGSANDLILIAEPEAAALYCLTDLYPSLLKVGETFVVVDCGGGTVDLVSYKVLQREPKFEVKEVAVGGGLCGSVFLNRRFESFIRRRLGPDTVDKMLKKGKPYNKMMKEFDERLKRIFKDTPDQEIMDCEVPGLPDDSDKRIEDGFVEIDREEMQDIFEPVIQEIIRLISQQIDLVQQNSFTRVSSILLVGGFGSSPYLYKRVQKHIEQRKLVSGDIKVLQPANAWSAVARGAVICGLQTVQIKSRQARRNYGIMFSTPFIEGKHPEQDRFWCALRRRYFCTNRMEWYVKTGDEVTEDKKISFPFYRVYSTTETEFSHSVVLLASNSPRGKAESQANDPNVYEICRITADMKSLRPHFELKKNDQGGSFHTISFSVVMYIHSAQLTFAIEHNGTTYGDKTTVTFV